MLLEFKAQSSKACHHDIYLKHTIAGITLTEALISYTESMQTDIKTDDVPEGETPAVFE